MKRTTAFLIGGGGFLAGLVTGTFWQPTIPMVGLLILTGLVTMLLAWRIPFLKRTSLFVLFLAFGLFYFLLWNKRTVGVMTLGSRAVFTAEIVSCRPVMRSFRCVLDATKPYDARMAARFSREYRPGDRVIVEGIPSSIPRESKYLSGDGVIAILDQPKILERQEQPSSLRTTLHRLKTASEERLTMSLTEPATSLASGLLFGSRQQFSREFLDALKATNTFHIIAVSGFNITILVEFIRWTLGRWPRKFVFAGTMMIITGFVLMIGAPASAVRAAIMGGIYLFGKLIGRKAYTPSVILLTALLMALPNPYLLRFDLGFQLSFLAFIGLVAIAPAIEPRLTVLPRPLRALAAATIGATLATSPLIVMLSSGHLSLIGPLVNLVVLPLVPLIMLLAGLVLFISILSLELARLLGLLLFLPSLFVVRVIEWAGNLPFANGPWLLTLSLFAVLFAVFLVAGRRHALAR